MNKEINFESRSHSTKNAEFEIFAHSRDGWHVNLKVSKLETVLNLKKKIEARKSFSDGFKLAFQGALLEDNKSVGEYSIRNGSRIDIIERCGGDVKIHVETVDKKTFGIDVDTDETVASMKMKIGEKIGLAPEEQKLWFEGVILDEDARTLDECGIGPQSEIIAVSRLRRAWPVYIRTLDDRKCTIAVDANETIAGVKMKIGEKLGIAPELRIYMFLDSKLDDAKTVDQCGIGEHSRITVMAHARDGFKLCIIGISEESIALDVLKHDTVGDLKRKIHEISKVDPEDFRLVFNFEKFDDNATTLEECGLGWYSTIHVVFPLR